MKNPIFIILLFISFFFQLNAQQNNQRPVNTISFNLLGNNGIGGSVGYERLYFFNKNTFVAGGIGLGTGKELFTNKSYISVPMHITGNYGSGRFFGELGVSGTYTSSLEKNFYLFPEAGIRIHPYKNSFFVRFYVIIYDFISVFPGLNFGYAF